jgi:hypothetical protein
MSLTVMSGCGTPLPDTIAYPPNENSTSTSSDAIPPTTTPSVEDTSSWTTYQNELGIHLKYPPRLEQQTSNGSPTILTYLFPKSDFQNTPLTEAKITLDFEKNSTQTKCLIHYNNITNYLKNNPDNQNQASTREIVRDLTWYRSEFKDAGAGSLFYTVAYEMLFNKQCYRLTLGLKSPLDPDSAATTNYNRQPFIDTIDKIADSFTPTPSIDSTTGTTSTPLSLTITVTDNNKTITLKKGDRFLIKLGDETYNWTVQPNDFTIISRVKNVAVVKGAQGIYQADHPGETDLVALGEPLCLKEEPGCKMASLNFKLHIVVK